METLEAIKSRRTIRKYLDIPIEWEKVGTVLEAGRLAPCAGNLQNWAFIVVTSTDSMRKITHACYDQYWMERTIVHIVIVSEPKKIEIMYGERGIKAYDYYDCAMVAENMLLAAVDQGLGCAFVGAFDERLLRQAVGAPDFVRMHGVITLGYPDETPPEPRKKPLIDVFYLNKYDNKIYNIDLVMDDWSEVMRKKMIELRKGVARRAPKALKKIHEAAKKIRRKAKGKLEEAKKAKEEERLMKEHEKKIAKLEEEWEEHRRKIERAKKKKRAEEEYI